MNNNLTYTYYKKGLSTLKLTSCIDNLSCSSNMQYLVLKILNDVKQTNKALLTKLCTMAKSKWFTVTGSIREVVLNEDHVNLQAIRS